MSSQAPAWAMAAQAVQASDQTHLRTGLHLRVMTSPLLGLPVTPFRILSHAVDTNTLRDDIVWTDAAPFPQRLTPPFDVTAERSAIGWLPSPADATCCWLELDADVPAGEELRVSAMVSTSRGVRAVATRSSRPHQVWASAVQHIVIEGRGTVNGVRWLPAALDSDSLVKLMGLPVARPHPRYAALDGGVLLAAARVARGAPQRRALYDTTGAPSPSDSPVLTVPGEVARVGALADVLRPDLLRLIDEPIFDPWLLGTTDDLVDERGVAIGTSTSNCIDAVLNSTIDHGLARWLGFLDNDILSSGEDNEIAARAVTAVFAPNWTELLTSGLLASLSPDAVVSDLAALRTIYPDFDALGDLEGTVDGPFLDVGVLAAYSTRHWIDPPPPLSIVSVTDRPTRTSDVEVSAISAWVPRLAPDAARSTRLAVHDLVPSAALAFARDDLAGIGPVGLNEPSGAAGFHQPLVAGSATTFTAPDDTTGGASVGTVGERSCPAGAVRYHIAQADWFGRWSNWSSVELAAGVRPQPPVPVVRVWATPPERPADTDDDGPLAGDITATIPVPAPADLPPGANVLTILRFQVTDAAGATSTTNHAVADPTAPPEHLMITVPGPPLSRGASTIATISAHWVDASGARSAPSTDLVLTIWDPRPPAPVTIDPTLRYASRPDVTGRARVEVTWPAASPQERFRVYYADETTLRARLAGTAAAAELLAALDAAPDTATRAVAWTDHAPVLPRAAFTLITPQPLERTGSEMRLEHAVSGSLKTLSLYRIVAVSGANVDVDFGTSPVVPYAVPNTLAPPQPHLAVRVLDPAVTGATGYTAELTVTVPRGSRRAVEYRMRRSRLSSADPLLMPIVATGPLHPPVDGADAHVEVVVDAGPTRLEPGGELAPWSEYTWRVEVRGEPEPGGGPPGSWSQPSAPTGTGVVPLSDPPPPTIRSLRRSGSGLRIGVDVPTDVRGGSLGVHRLELYRQLPDDRERRIAVIDEQQRPAGDAAWPFVDDSFTGAPPPGTSYRAVIVDPRGRRSPPSPARRTR